jgi:hypothetical protein
LSFPEGKQRDEVIEAFHQCVQAISGEPLLRESYYSLIKSWTSADDSQSRRGKQAIWAIWALARKSPTNALRTARDIDLSELEWQINRLKAWISTRAETIVV